MEYWLTEHLRLNGVYWGLTALHLLGRPDGLPRDATIDFVLSCQHENGGFGAAPGHDPHMLYTVSAIQILATVHALDALEADGRGGKEKVVQCARSVASHSFIGINNVSQTLLASKAIPQAPLLVTSGANTIPAFSMVPSMLFRFCARFMPSTLPRPSATLKLVPTSMAVMVSVLVLNHILDKSSRVWVLWRSLAVWTWWTKIGWVPG